MSLKDYWNLDIFEKTIGRIPIIGTPIAAILMMVFAMAYWVILITLFTFVLIPFLLIKGIIAPNSAIGKFPFDSPEDSTEMSRLGFFMILLMGYGLPVGFFLYLWLSK